MSITKPSKEQSEAKNLAFKEVCDLIYDLQCYKGQTYGDSWCKHGEAISIFGNVARKYDRIENIITDHIENAKDLPAPNSEESLSETIADLGVYCILWMTWIKENRPEEYKHWMCKIKELSGWRKCD